MPSMVKIAFITTHMNYFMPFTAAAQSVQTKFGLKVDGCIKTVKDLEEPNSLNSFIKYAHDSQIVIVHFLGSKENNPHLTSFLSTIRGFHVPLFIATVPFDKELSDYSNIDASDSEKIFQYLNYGGAENFENMLLFLANHFSFTDFPFDMPKQLPWDGFLSP
jgi:cobaltochelatase CobN